MPRQCVTLPQQGVHSEGSQDAKHAVSADLIVVAIMLKRGDISVMMTDPQEQVLEKDNVVPTRLELGHFCHCSTLGTTRLLYESVVFTSDENPSAAVRC